MVSPFKTGNGLVLQSDKSTVGASWYLDSAPSAEKSTSVYLSERRDFRTHRGCYWQIILRPDNTLRLKTVSEGSYQYLDSSAAADKSTPTMFNINACEQNAFCMNFVEILSITYAQNNCSSLHDMLFVALQNLNFSRPARCVQ